MQPKGVVATSEPAAEDAADSPQKNASDNSITIFAFIVAIQDMWLLNVQQHPIVIHSLVLLCANSKWFKKEDRPSQKCKTTQISMLYQHSMQLMPSWPTPTLKNNLFDPLSCCIVRESCT